ncbi:alpha/beta hydrolase [Oenococcus alcoholitolerans]|uniref:alpha/beta hydrolase n=1 Tax=Oenococcus alcoholitolerans TaxID=931074 RepID=UPI003F6F5A5B
MKNLTFNFFSKSLNMSTTFKMILPDLISDSTKILILLHGMGDDENSWERNTLLDKYLENKSLVVVMPRVDLSYYQNFAKSAYFDFVAFEILEQMKDVFHLNTARKNTFVAGVSMGGYGALKIVLTFPDKFSACFALSPNTDLLESWQEDSSREAWFSALFKDKKTFKNSDNNLFNLIKKPGTGLDKPFIDIECGRKDHFVHRCRSFYEQARKAGFNIVFNTYPNEKHEWSFWDRSIAGIIDFI